MGRSRALSRETAAGVLRRQISARVQAAIDESEYSKTRVAELTGIPRETLNRRLDNVGPSFNVDELEDIARVLGLPYDAFLDAAQWPEAS